MPRLPLSRSASRTLLPGALALALAACAPAHFLAQSTQLELAAGGALVHDGGIVFAKDYPAPRLENPHLVPIFAAAPGQALDPEAARKLIALTNGQKTGYLPEAGQIQVGVRVAPFAGSLGLLAVDATAHAGAGAGSPAQEARYALAHAPLEADVPFFAVRDGGQALPATVDLRPQMPPVRDQGTRNMGVAFATAAMLDYLAAHDPNLPIKHASPQFLNWRYQIQIKSKLSDERGRVWSARDTYQTLFFSLLHIDGNPTPTADTPYVPPLQGYVGEDTCPYRPELQPLPPDTNILEAARQHLGDALAQRVVDHAPIPSQGAFFYRLKTDAATYEAALAGGNPIQITLPVYLPDWASPPAGEHYRLAEMSVEKGADPNNLAYQAVVIAGYEKDADAPGGGWFIVRNSWGDGWGEGGYCRVSYRSIMAFGYAAHIAVTYAKPFDGVYDPFPPPDSPEHDPNAGRPLPPITDTEAWGAYTSVTAAKEGDLLRNVPAPPVPVNDLGLPIARGNEGDSYASDQWGPGKYGGPPGWNGAEEPLSSPPGLDTPAPTVAPASSAPAQPSAAPTASTAPASTAPASTVPASAAPASTAPASTAPASTAPASAAPASSAPSTPAPARS